MRQRRDAASARRGSDTEHGYDKTSLRDIAERLGTTKAAPYYRARGGLAGSDRPLHFEDLHRSECHRLNNDDMERQFRRLLSSPDIPVATRVRMACSIGAMGGMLGTSMLDDVPDDALTDLVREAVSDMFSSR